MDRPAWGLGMALTYTAVGLGGAYAAAPFGIEAVVAVWVGRALILLPLHVMLASKLLATPPARIAGPAAAPLVTTVLMAACIVPLHLVLPAGLPSWAVLGALVTAGAVVYAGAIRLLYPQLFGMAWRTAAVAATPRRPSQSPQ